MFAVRADRRRLRPSLLLTSGGSVWTRPRPPEPAPRRTPSPRLSPPGCGEEDTVGPEGPETEKQEQGERRVRKGAEKCVCAL